MEVNYIKEYGSATYDQMIELGFTKFSRWDITEEFNIEEE